MINTEYIKNLNSLSLIELIKIDNEIENYISWNSLDEVFKSKLEFIGEIKINNQKEVYEDENYWRPDATISLRNYPYFGCKLYKHKSHESYYLIYKEFGGNIPEERCRLLQKRLIVNDINI
jgi:hypothetical protein